MSDKLREAAEVLVSYRKSVRAQRPADLKELLDQFETLDAMIDYLRAALADAPKASALAGARELCAEQLRDPSLWCETESPYISALQAALKKLHEAVMAEPVPQASECPTCHGRGELLEIDPNSGDSRPYPCPDCQPAPQASEPITFDEITELLCKVPGWYRMTKEQLVRWVYHKMRSEEFTPHLDTSGDARLDATPATQATQGEEELAWFLEEALRQLEDVGVGRSGGQHVSPRRELSQHSFVTKARQLLAARRAGRET